MSNQIQIFNFQNNPNFPVKVIIQNNKEYFLAKKSIAKIVKNS